MNFPTDAVLYGILDLGYVEEAAAPTMTQHLLDGGVQILQLRAKKLTRDDILRLSESIAPLCNAAGVPFILNDHPDLVKECGADGVHVGQDDPAVSDVREMVGPGAIIGLSTHSLAQAEAALACRPDYIGFGPLFATPTKPDYEAIGLADIAAAHRNVALPIFCIGGIKLENLPRVLEAGARRVVIVSGLLQAADPAAYGRACRAALGA